MVAPEALTVDVREDLRRGKEPFGRIMEALGQLQPGQSMRLLATFEPIPLFKVLGAKGYTHQAKRVGEGDWEVLFTPKDAGDEQADAPGNAQAAAAPDAGVSQGAGESAEAWPAPVKRLDNRGLMPPEPMVRILEALEHLEPGQVIEAFNDRKPRFLYPELEKRNHAIKTEELAEGQGVRLLIRSGQRG